MRQYGQIAHDQSFRVLRNIFKIKEIPKFSKDFSGVKYGNCVNQGSLKEQNLQKKKYMYLYILVYRIYIYMVFIRVAHRLGPSYSNNE